MIHAVLLTVCAATGQTPAVDFDTEIVPILTKAGCNTGACHGSAAGRGGFKLSLYGGNPREDYEAIALELESRRVNLRTPDESLVYMKPTGWLDHEGGERFPDDGAAATILLNWIRGGARRDQLRTLTEFEVSPARAWNLELESEVHLRATARFDDGSVVDVTDWTVFTPEDPAGVQIDDDAHAIVHRRGRHLVVARYLDRVVPLELVVPLTGEAVDLSGEPRRNFVDEFVYARLRTLRLPVSPAADDATIARRLYLDLCGRLPPPNEVLKYQAETAADKREQLVDRLLRSDAFTEFWTYRFAKLLRIRAQPQDSRGAETYYAWLTHQIAEGAPYDEFARELLTAEGDTHVYGPANFYTGVGDARGQAEFVSDLLLGVRLRCANCHNHPLDKWTQDDYHGLAALFAGIERGRVVRFGSGEVTHPRTQQAAVPRIPGERFVEEGGDCRDQLADWITSPDNPYFARAAVNRIWSDLMGRGLVNPTDDLRETNPATHPELLNELARDFIASGYDLRHTIRLICTSETYGRSAETLASNRSDDRYYSHALVRPLEPEVLADALADVTGVADQYGDEPLDTRAVSLVDPGIPSVALDILGRCSREDSCETPAGTGGGGLALKLHLVNGELINRKVSHPEGGLSKLIERGTSADEIVEAFYLRGLSRTPSAEEREFWREQFAGTTTEREFRELAEDFLWGLLTSREFSTNH